MGIRSEALNNRREDMIDRLSEKSQDDFLHYLDVAGLKMSVRELRTISMNRYGKKVYGTKELILEQMKNLEDTKTETRRTFNWR